MNGETVVACINECCKSWHDNNLSLLAAALLLRHFYVPSSDNETTDVVDTPMSLHEHTTLSLLPSENAVTHNNLITSTSAPTYTNPTDKNKTSTINTLIHVSATSTPSMEDTSSSKTPSTPPTKLPSPTNYSTPTPLALPPPPTPCPPIHPDSLSPSPAPPQDSIHHHTELIPVVQDHSSVVSSVPSPSNVVSAPSPPPTSDPFIPVNATVLTRHVKECGHNIICILQKNGFSLSTSKKVSAASQQVYVNHVYPHIDTSKNVQEMIVIIKEFWKGQVAPSPLSFCGLVTYMKNLTTSTAAPDTTVTSLYPHVSVYPPLALCPPSPVTPGPRRKRIKVDPAATMLVMPDSNMLVQQLQACTDHNKALQNRITAIESDLKNVHQICLQQECELKSISQVCIAPKPTFQVPLPIDNNELKVVPWPLGEKVVGVNHSLWQINYTPHALPSYWFREEQHILDVINDKEGDIICGYHVTQDILLMKVDLDWLKKSFDHPTRKAEETMQHLELAYARFDGYVAESGEVGLFSKGFAKVVRKMTLHKKLNV